MVFVSIGLLYEDKSCLPNTWLPKCTNWMRNEVSNSKPIPPENVAIAIGWPLNKFLKSSPEIDNQDSGESNQNIKEMRIKVLNDDGVEKEIIIRYTN